MSDCDESWDSSRNFDERNENYPRNDDNDDDDEEDMMDACCLNDESDPFMVAYRERRLKELGTIIDKPHVSQVDDEYQAHGKLYLAQNEAEVFEWTTKEPLVIIHFFLPSFRMCDIMDTHLKRLAEKHVKIRWGKVNVSNAPFLTQKLAIKVLPCVDIFINGIKVDRIVGFDDLGGSPEFGTGQLEKRISSSGIFALTCVVGIFNRESSLTAGQESD